MIRTGTPRVARPRRSRDLRRVWAERPRGYGSRMDADQPEADVAEQQRLVDDRDDQDDRDTGPGRPTAAVDAFTDPDGFPTEADPADVAEQRAIVPQDVDEP